MIVKSIKLTNFKLHESLILHLPNTVTLIVGENGSGKTSMVEALAWSIFGVSALDTTQNYIISDSKKFCRVISEIEINKQLYTFTRYFNGTNVEAKLERDKELVADTPKGIAAFLKTLGLDWQLFRVAYAKQGDLDYLITCPSSERKNLLTEILDLDVLDKIDSKLKDSINVIEKVYNEFKSGERRVVIATQIFEEGINIERLGIVINGGGLKSHFKTNQKLGRGMRKRIIVNNGKCIFREKRSVNDTKTRQYDKRY